MQRLEHVKKLIAGREENHERIDQRDTPPPKGNEEKEHVNLMWQK